MASVKAWTRGVVRFIRPFISNKIAAVLGGAVTMAVSTSGNREVLEQATAAKDAAAATLDAAASAVDSIAMVVSSADKVVDAAAAGNGALAIAAVLGFTAVGLIEKGKDIFDGWLAPGGWLAEDEAPTPAQ